ncbi:MAG: HAD-IC family P-type ATPase [Acholeplasmataceae bacterium]|jgi:cation-transporting ATPase E|nr:HAD-IC family P-type ATPase [Acholeplasmataceae bacterium]
MEKAVEKKMSKREANQDLDALIDDGSDQTIDKPKRSKGPKTVIKEELVTMQGDPLGLHVPLDDEPEEAIDLKSRVKTKDDIVVERYNPEIEKGLSTEEVELRQMAGLANVGDMGSSKSIPTIITSNIFTFFNFLNFGIAAWLISVKAAISQLFFMGVITANITIGIIQEIRAKKTIDKLSLLTAPTALVMRDGTELEIGISDVVIDDILFLSSGKQIPADAVVRQGVVEVNESLLTGESDPIIKKKGDTLYSGSFIVSGTCYAQTTAVGHNIYIQKLTNQAKKYKKPQSDLLGSLKAIIRIVGALIIPIAATLFYLMSTYSDLPYNEIVQKTAGAMIGMIPSGLFLLTSMALAVGVIRLAQNNTLVQELYCIEMLARVDTLCLDKTGTITDGTMTVKSIIEYKNDTGLALKNIVSAMINAQNDSNLTSDALAERFGTAKRIRHKALIAFSSQRKYSAVQFDRYGTFVLGAPEFVIKDNYHQIAKEVDKQSQEGYRVLAVAYSDGDIIDNQVQGKVTPLALIMIEDTIRPDAIDTIEYFKSHNVDVKVISGDNPVTVSRISQRSGIANADKYISLEGMQDKEVVRSASRFTVFGRVSPHQKKLLIESLKNNGRTVAMTGDGVNDILALKEADTSIAMASGSEAARNVSHLVLLDSNFSSMPKVVSEGRRVINNVQRVSTLFLTKTIFSFLLAVVAIIRQGVYPIQPNQLILIDYLVIGIPSFFLALEPNNKQVKGKFLWNILKAALPGALVVMINSLIIFAFQPSLGMSDKITETLVVISATVVSLTVLYRVSTPFNKMRRILFMLMVAAFIFGIFFMPNFFQFIPIVPSKFYDSTIVLGAPHILLLLVLAQATFPMMYVLSNLYSWIKQFVRTIINKIADIQ